MSFSTHDSTKLDDPNRIMIKYRISWPQSSLPTSLRGSSIFGVVRSFVRRFLSVLQPSPTVTLKCPGAILVRCCCLFQKPWDYIGQWNHPEPSPQQRYKTCWHRSFPTLRSRLWEQTKNAWHKIFIIRANGDMESDGESKWQLYLPKILADHRFDIEK